MSKWKKVDIHSGQEIDEDAPANSAGAGNVAGIGVDHPDYPGSGEPGVDPKKKKKKMSLIDGRTKAYREHRKRLETASEKRETARLKKEGSWSESVLHKLSGVDEDS